MNNGIVAVTFTASARQLGIVSSVGTVLLIVSYATTLIAGFLSVGSPEQPIGNPWFSILEVLIILLMPLLVGLMVAVNAWASAEARVFSLMSLIFMTLVAGLTCSLHFAILTLSRKAEFSDLAWMPLFMSFKWPSVPYALDTMAWDGFFALSALCAAPVFSGSRLAAWIRLLLATSGLLALAGLSGVIVSDMHLRNIGIIGYVGVFPVAALLLALFFYRAAHHRNLPVLEEPLRLKGTA